MGVTSTALPQLKNSFGLSRSQQEMVVSFLYIGCSIGATAGGFLCDKYGRKRMILVTDSIFVLAALVLYTAWSFDILLLGRILVGFAVAVSGIADVAYLHEISPKEYRGAIVSCNEACISLGFMLSYLIGYAISVRVPQDGWRLMFGIGSIIAFIQFIAMLFMPESPIWLQQHRGYCTNQGTSTTTIRTNTANTEMQIVMPDIGRKISSDNNDTRDLTTHSGHQLMADRDRDGEPVFAQYSSLNVDHREPQGIISEEPIETLTLQTLNKYYRQVIISLFLSVMQNFCGHPNVLNFAPEIFGQIGFTSETDRLISTTFLGVVKFLTVCYAIKKVEVYGRRYLLLRGMTIIATSLFVLFLVYAIGGDEDISRVGKFCATLAVFGIAAGYSLSFGPLVWLIVSELFPSSIRGRALGGSTICSYVSASVVSYTFLTGQLIGMYFPFAIYGLLTMFAIYFTYRYIPDTVGKSANDIHAELEEFWGFANDAATSRYQRQQSSTEFRVAALDHTIS
mmetsp:Transcript_12602/g.23641  ORF Transcript_12602/g.23641 Transcript_12602/m.23641 type:complete len:509 (-) Transcript_12602:96-1622(-)